MNDYIDSINRLQSVSDDNITNQKLTIRNNDKKLKDLSKKIYNLLKIGNSLNFYQIVNLQKAQNEYWTVLLKNYPDLNIKELTLFEV